MWTLQKTFNFEAAHQLPFHQGKCARLHGHSWQLTVFVQGASLIQTGSSVGMIQDYGDISVVVKPLLESHLDHYYLNETTGLENPTSEEIARWIYEQLDGKINGLVAIGIRETCTAECIYSPDRRNFPLSSG